LLFFLTMITITNMSPWILFQLHELE